MAHEIFNLAESEKIRRLYNEGPNWYDYRCHASWKYLHPGFISITTREQKHIYALFSAINGHGVEL
jgi:hypothetical protein